MANATLQPAAKTQQLMRNERRRMFAANDDNAMMKQIQSTHSPDGREVEVKPILNIIEDILRRASFQSIDGVVNGTHAQMETLEDKSTIAGFDGMMDIVALIIQKISCEMSCKCSGGGDAHATTLALFNMLSSYSWDAKVVLSLAAFSTYYGEFWLVAQLYTKNSLAKSIALLKQLPEIIEHSNALKSRFDALNNLIKAMLYVTKCIVEFKELPVQYISQDTLPMSIAMAHIPTASYWTIRSMVACASQIASLVGMSHEYIAATSEAWELSSLAHKVNNIYDHLKQQLVQCYQHIDEKRHIEAFHNLVRLFEMLHLDNMKILKALISPKDDLQPLVDGNKTRVNIEVLRRKNVLLLISDLDISQEEVMILESIYRESRGRSDIQYEVVWLPIVDRSTPWNEVNRHKFEQLQSMMPWYKIHHPSLVEPEVIRYTREVWHFAKKPILVVLDSQGRLACRNALHMMWIWGSLAFPFTSLKEESLWKAETWRLELLVDSIDLTILEWITEGRIICLYGGENIEWIRNFTTKAKSVTKVAGITLEMIYVGSSNAKERVRKNIEAIIAENLSNSLPNLMSVRFFWSRLESMLYSKMEHGKTTENDHIMQEVMTMLSFDGSDQGWAVIGQGSAEILAKAKGDTVLTSMVEFDKWEEDSKQKGFVQALIEYLHKLHTPQHCNRLILPGISGGIPERVVCAECNRPMEQFFMYRCCVD